MAARIVAERDRHCVACVGELGGRCQTRAHGRGSVFTSRKMRWVRDPEASLAVVRDPLTKKRRFKEHPSTEWVVVSA